jgi:hypothetical protein
MIWICYSNFFSDALDHFSFFRIKGRMLPPPNATTGVQMLLGLPPSHVMRKRSLLEFTDPTAMNQANLRFSGMSCSYIGSLVPFVNGVRESTSLLILQNSYYNPARVQGMGSQVSA